MMRSRVISLLVGFFFLQVCPAQQKYYPFEVDNYPFINYQKNKISFFKDSSNFAQVLSKFNRLLFEGNGQLRIVHIGGSHIQADVYTHRLRQRFSEFQNGLSGSRGFLFPYRVAKTNNPRNYKIKYEGEWDYCKNVKKKADCKLGLSGISIITQDIYSKVQVTLNNDSSLYYDFNSLKIFHDLDSTTFDINLNGKADIISQNRNDSLGYTEYIFSDFMDSITISFSRIDSSQTNFTLYGLYFENNDPGVVYNAIGVNGARLDSYIECELFESHLSALNPDMIIISIGTNDAYTRRFNQEKYRTNYYRLLAKIKEAQPNATILLTVPNDSYLYRRYINRNTEKVKNVIFDISKNEGYGVWNFYEIMGGLNSSYIWYRTGLMTSDKIHFNRKGYNLKGDLFFAAFLKAYDNHLVGKQNSGLSLNKTYYSRVKQDENKKNNY